MVVKCSAEYLSMKRMERDTAAVNLMGVERGTEEWRQTIRFENHINHSSQVSTLTEIFESNLTYSCAHTLLSLPTRQGRHTHSVRSQYIFSSIVISTFHVAFRGDGEGL